MGELILSKISFDGQVAIVTGAGRGLGRAYALELASRGASVVVNDIGHDEGAPASRADTVAEEIVAAGGKSLASHHDISTAQGGQALIDATISHFGTIDALVNNAGFLRPAPFEDQSIGDTQAVIGVHLLAAFHVTQPAWRVMREKGYGRIVMTASSSIFGHPGNSNYAAAKGGVFGLSQTMALEGAELGIKVNCLFPMSETKISTDNPLAGPLHARVAAGLARLQGRRPPTSVAPLVVYLASRDCAVTGATYSAGAGRYARVFLGFGDGWLADDISAVTVEDIGQHLDEINSAANFLAPTRMVEEIEEIARRLEAKSPNKQAES
jgi:NAD(P)-dependent dehydrogenase (short-subunit alcohol dehydrogenase family)